MFELAIVRRDVLYFAISRNANVRITSFRVSKLRIYIINFLIVKMYNAIEVEIYLLSCLLNYPFKLPLQDTVLS